MRQLVTKLILLLAILLAIKLPFGMREPDPLDSKWSALAAADYNTVFVGSSRTQYDVDASGFDRATAGRTRSFNLGVATALPPETFAWCHEIITRDGRLKYLFVELSGVTQDLEMDMLRPRAYRASNYPWWLRTMPIRRWSEYHDHLFVSLLRPALLLGRHIEPPPDPSKLLAAFERNRALEMPDGPPYEARHEQYQSEMNDLIALAESRGVTLYFFPPPRLETDHEMETIYPVYRRIDPKYLIDGGHDAPDINTLETSMDDYHLNPAGAALYTARLAAAFNDRTR